MSSSRDALLWKIQELKDTIRANKLLIKALREDRKKQLASMEQYRKESIKWSAEDFIERAKEQGKRIGKRAAQEALEAMIADHDCNYGICWHTIDAYIERYGN